MKRFILMPISIGMLVLQACSSTPPVKGYIDDEVLATANNKSQPDWADETKPFYVQNGKVYSVGVTTLRGSDRPEAGGRIAENNARANFSKSIENRMEFIFQNSEENAEVDSSQAQFIGSEVSSLTSHSMTLEGHWWKRYAQSDEDGSRRLFYKVYSLISMPESELKKAIDSAINHKVEDKKISQSFKEKVDKQWDRFVEATNDVQKTVIEKPTEEKVEKVIQKTVEEKVVSLESKPQTQTVASETVKKDGE
jgi:hypothetical protein